MGWTGAMNRTPTGYRLTPDGSPLTPDSSKLEAHISPSPQPLISARDCTYAPFCASIGPPHIQLRE
jgi:hypothetical protein